MSLYGIRNFCLGKQADTMKFQMFRGTLKLNTLIATLQPVDKICEVAISLSCEELKGLSYTT